MGKFILQRLQAALVTIWIATIAVTILIHLVPGDPVRIMYGSFQTTPEELEAMLGKTHARQLWDLAEEAKSLQ